jgi:uncharacterized delta-60 repeat protein
VRIGRATLLAASGVAFALHTTYTQAAPGDLDPSFSRDGKRGIDFGFTRDSGAVLDIEQLADGRIVVVASSRPGNGIIALARLRANGSLDTSYSADGTQIVDPPGEHTWSGASIDSDGSVAVAGTQWPGKGDFAVARVRSDGELDSSFSGDGVQQIEFGPDSGDVANAVVTQPGGKHVVGGFAGANGERDFALARLEQDGDLDPGFSEDGRATVAFAESSNVDDLALPESGEIVAKESTYRLSRSPA